ncbi:hypothetical protein HK102_003071 [Quaeritorhiza haematococci]|nr:hypothetical protein HK102_003071 [Quaeritorhiza haematococci]
MPGSGIPSLIHKAAKDGDLDALYERLDELDSSERDIDIRSKGKIIQKYATGHEEIVSWAIANGADVNANTVTGDTPLILASQRGFINIVKMLIEAGASANLANDHGNTALHYACFWRHPEVAVYLVRNAGAYVNVLNKHQKKPLDRGGKEMAELVLGAAVNATEVVNAPARSFEDAELEAKMRFIAKGM